SYFHPTLDRARAEAERLCRKEGAEFLVLEVVGKGGPGPVRWDEFTGRGFFIGENNG
ncbi:MAG: hypothetical protein UX65_C0010G0026, partial [Parcubacteria group bacterium GW2011_GWB1_46_8]